MHASLVHSKKIRMKSQRYFFLAVTVMATFTFVLSLGHALPMREQDGDTKGQYDTFSLKRIAGVCLPRIGCVWMLYSFVLFQKLLILTWS